MAENTISANAHVRKHLEQINLHLQLIYSGILVSADALRHQNCERDEDVANVLVHSVSERLSVQMERIAEIVAFLNSPGSEPNPADCEDPILPLKHLQPGSHDRAAFRNTVTASISGGSNA